MKTVMRLRWLCVMAWVTQLGSLMGQDKIPSLAGEWEIHVGSHATGIVLQVEQQGGVLEAKYQVVLPNNKYGLKPGFPFFRVQMQEQQGKVLGKGEMVVRKGDVTKGDVIETSQKHVSVILTDEGQTMKCRIKGEGVRDSERRYDLKRLSKVKAMRLYVSTADGLQPVSKVVEGALMVVDLEFSAASRRPLQVKLDGGNGELRLLANAVDGVTNDAQGNQVWHSRTNPFVASYGGQLGAPTRPETEAAAESRRDPEREDWKKIAGMWKAVYRDSVLGDVTGYMKIDEYGTVSARYRHPETNRWEEMALESATLGPVQPPGDVPEDSASPSPVAGGLGDWKIVLAGRGVHSEKVENDPKNYPQLKLKTYVEEPVPVKVTAGRLQAELEVELFQAADSSKVELSFDRKQDGNLLVWDWRYKAKRSTSRDGEGLGRVGVMVPMEDQPDATVAWQKGKEVWMKDAPAIVDAICLDDQLAIEQGKSFYGRPVPRFRYADVKNPRSDATLPRSGNPLRKVFIVARGLPPLDMGKVMVDVGDGSGVKKYRVRGRGKEGAHGNSAEMKEAWIKYRSMRPDRAVSYDGDPVPPEGEIEGMFVHVDLKDDAPPGLQAFKIGASSGEWNLQYGDTVGRLELVRKLADEEVHDQGTEPREWEGSAQVFVPEQVRASVRAGTEIDSREEITVAIVIERKGASEPVPLTYKGKRKIKLVRDPNDKKRYLSPIIELVSQGQVEKVKELQPNDMVVGVSKGDKIKVMVEPDSGYYVAPLVTEAEVYTSPENINALWKSALKRAADLAGQPIHDWNEVARGEAKQVNNVIVTELVMAEAMDLFGTMTILEAAGKAANFEPPLVRYWKKSQRGAMRSLEISIGDHAAMLLLRDMFIEMMKEEHQDWKKNLGEQKIKNIFGSQKGLVGAKRSPLSFYKVTLRNLPMFRNSEPDDTAYLYELFSEEYLRDDLDVRGGADTIEAIQWAAFRHSYQKWGAAMTSSIEEARRISDGDVDKLMKLTGYGFEPIAKRLLPQMMKLENVSNNQARWVPDRVARAYVSSLYVLGDAVKAQQDYADIDTTFAMTAFSLVTIPLGNVGGFWSAAAVLTYSVADAAYAVYTDIIKSNRAEDELASEVGMGAVLGYGRAAEKRSQITETWQKGLAIAGGGLGVATDAFAAVKAVRKLRPSAILSEGAEILKRVDFADPATLKALSKHDQAVLKRFVDGAGEMAEAGKLDDLTDAQRAALQNQHQLGNIFEESGVAAAAADRATTLNQTARPVKVKELEDISKGLNDTIASTEGKVARAKKALDKAKEAAEAAGEPAAKARAAKKVEAAEDAVTDAKDALGEYQQRKNVLDGLVEKAKRSAPEHVKNADGSGYVKFKGPENPPVKLTQTDMDLLRGRSPKMSPADQRRAEAVLRQNGGDWSKVKKLAGKTPEEQLDLHRVATYRRNLVNKLADDSMAETKALLESQGVKDVNLRRNAFGSTNLTSDYDVAIKGKGAEVAVSRFNDKIRKVFGGTESGTVVDTNLYTDPVYNQFKNADLAGKEAGVELAKLDSMKQFMFQQMANVKYRSPAQWQALRKSMLDGMDPTTRRAMSEVFDQAEGAKNAAEGLLAKRLASMGDDVSGVSGNKALKATNELYGEALTDIHHYRSMIDDLDQVGSGAKKAGEMNLPPELNTKQFKKTLDTVDKMMASGNPKKVAQAKKALEQIRNRAAVNVRNKQGLALYYASEAYQTRGTISHVVQELQAKGIKLKPDDLLDGKMRKTDLKPDDYVNSYYENGANLIKELRGKGVFDAAGQLIPGHGKMDDAAQKVAKYFERQLDAANQAGVKFRETGIDEIDKVVKGTVELNAVRSDPAKFAKKLEQLGWTSEDYVGNVMKATDNLDSRVIKKASVMDTARDVYDSERKADRAALRAARFGDALTAVGKSGNIKTVLYPPTQYEGEAKKRHVDSVVREIEGLEEKSGSGRFLTSEQQKRLQELKATDRRQVEMERMSSAARDAGVSEEEVNRVIRESEDKPGQWRESAAKRLEDSMKQRLDRRTQERWKEDKPAEVDPRVMREFGIDATTPVPSTAGDLREKLKAAGKNVVDIGERPTLDVLAQQAASGRKPLVMMDDGKGNTRWVEVAGVAGEEGGRKWVQVKDPESGGVLSYPKELFMSRSQSMSRSVVVDPRRDEKGKWVKAGEKEVDVQEEIRVAVPLPGE